MHSSIRHVRSFIQSSIHPSVHPPIYPSSHWLSASLWYFCFRRPPRPDRPSKLAGTVPLARVYRLRRFGPALRQLSHPLPPLRGICVGLGQGGYLWIIAHSSSYTGRFLFIIYHLSIIEYRLSFLSCLAYIFAIIILILGLIFLFLDSRVSSLDSDVRADSHYRYNSLMCLCSLHFSYLSFLDYHFSFFVHQFSFINEPLCFIIFSRFSFLDYRLPFARFSSVICHLCVTCQSIYHLAFANHSRSVSGKGLHEWRLFRGHTKGEGRG